MLPQPTSQPHLVFFPFYFKALSCVGWNFIIKSIKHAILKFITKANEWVGWVGNGWDLTVRRIKFSFFIGWVCEPFVFFHHSNRLYQIYSLPTHPHPSASYIAISILCIRAHTLSTNHHPILLSIIFQCATKRGNFVYLRFDAQNNFSLGFWSKKTFFLFSLCLWKFVYFQFCWSKFC